MLKLTFILYRLNYPTKDRHILFELGVDKKKKKKKRNYIYTWKHNDNQDVCGIGEDPGKGVNAGESPEPIYLFWGRKKEKKRKA